jgi:hypothetical protein
MQEWFNLPRDVLRLRRTPPLVSFLVGWLGQVGGMMKEREFCVFSIFDTSMGLLHAVNSYDMGPSHFTSHPRGRCAADFYRP